MRLRTANDPQRDGVRSCFDEIEVLTFKGKLSIVYGGSGLVLVGLLDFKSSGGC